MRPNWNKKKKKMQQKQKVSTRRKKLYTHIYVRKYFFSSFSTIIFSTKPSNVYKIDTYFYKY
jgi:hypothetical protein